MTPEEFDDLKIGGTIYRINEGDLRAYQVIHKTEFSCKIDRPCILTISRALSGDGKKMMMKMAVRYFWVTARGAFRAERDRILEVIQYHHDEKRKARQALANLAKLEQSHEI